MGKNTPEETSEEGKKPSTTSTGYTVDVNTTTNRTSSERGTGSTTPADKT